MKWKFETWSNIYQDWVHLEGPFDSRTDADRYYRTRTTKPMRVLVQQNDDAPWLNMHREVVVPRTDI